MSVMISRHFQADKNAPRRFEIYGPRDHTGAGALREALRVSQYRNPTLLKASKAFSTGMSVGNTTLVMLLKQDNMRPKQPPQWAASPGPAIWYHVDGVSQHPTSNPKHHAAGRRRLARAYTAIYKPCDVAPADHRPTNRRVCK